MCILFHGFLKLKILSISVHLQSHWIWRQQETKCKTKRTLKGWLLFLIGIIMCPFADSWHFSLLWLACSLEGANHYFLYCDHRMYAGRRRCISDSRKFSALGNGLCSLEIGHWVLWSTEERVIRDKQIPEAKHRSLHSDSSLTALMGFLTDCYWKIKDKNRTI